MSYDVFLLAGQSNAVGRGQTLDAAQDAVVVAGVKQWDTATSSVIDAVNPLRNFDPTTTVGFAYRFAVLYKQSTGRDVLIVPRAKGGSGFANNGWGTDKVYHEGAIAQANAALAATGGTFKGILWHQGENDAIIPYSEVQYRDALAGLVQDFRNRITSAGNALFVCGGLASLWLAENPTRLGVQTALESVATYIDRSAYVTSEGLSSNSTLDSVHFSAAAQREFGQRYLQVYQALEESIVLGNDDRTSARGYRKPAPTNLLSQDVLRLRATLDSIDQDIAQLFELTTMKNYPDIRPSLLLDFANSGYLDSRLSFTRATPGTFVTSDGRIASALANVPRFELNFATGERLGLRIQPGRTNRALYSEELDNAYWTKAGATIQANADVAPDGTQTADKIVESSANELRYVLASFDVTAGTRYSFSVFLKDSGRSLATVYAGSAAGSPWINVNLAIGEIIASSASPAANLQASAQRLGSGWVRVSISFTATTTANAGMVVTPADADYGSSPQSTGRPYLGNGASGILAWGLQFEIGASPSSYIKTTTAQATRAADVVTSSETSWFNLAEGSFFVDAAADSSPNADLSTNQLSSNSAFNLWSTLNATVSADTSSAPDSTQTADRIVETTATGSHYVQAGVTFNATSKYVLTVYAKAAERSNFSMITAGAVAAGGFFNLSSGLATAVGTGVNGLTASMQLDSNGWYLCRVELETTATLPSSVRLYLSNSTTATLAPSYAGNSSSGMLFWDARLQLVTSGESNILTSLDSGTAQNLIEVGIRNFSVLAPNSTVAASLSPNLPVYVSNSPRKLAAAYQQNDFVFRAGDGNTASNTSGAVLTNAPSTFRIGGSQAGKYMNGYIRRIAYYPKRIPNLELDSLLS